MAIQAMETGWNGTYGQAAEGSFEDHFRLSAPTPDGQVALDAAETILSWRHAVAERFPQQPTGADMLG